MLRIVNRKLGVREREREREEVKKWSSEKNFNNEKFAEFFRSRLFHFQGQKTAVGVRLYEKELQF